MGLSLELVGVILSFLETDTLLKSLEMKMFFWRFVKHHWLLGDVLFDENVIYLLSKYHNIAPDTIPFVYKLRLCKKIINIDLPNLQEVSYKCVFCKDTFTYKTVCELKKELISHHYKFHDVSYNGLSCLSCLYISPTYYFCPYWRINLYCYKGCGICRKQLLGEKGYINHRYQTHGDQYYYSLCIACALSFFHNNINEENASKFINQIKRVNLPKRILCDMCKVKEVGKGESITCFKCKRECEAKEREVMGRRLSILGGIVFIFLASYENGVNNLAKFFVALVIFYPRYIVLWLNYVYSQLLCLLYN